MRRPSARAQVALRGAFTLIEVLTVIAIIAVLMAIVLPAIQSSRAAARRSQCASNLHNVALAVHSHGDVTGGKYPALTVQHGDHSYSWAVELFPFLESRVLYNRIAENNPGFEPGEFPNIAVFKCPASVQHRDQPGGMSYVANAGYMRADLWGDNEGHHAMQINWDRACCPEPYLTEGDIELAHATGVFWREMETASESRPSMSYVESGDGLGYTFLVSENLQSGTYDSTTTGRIAFGLSIPVDETIAPWHISTGRVGRCECECLPAPPRNCGDNTPANLVLLDSFSVHNKENDHDARINRRLMSSTGTTPRPSSLHPGGVNMLWCDGRVTFVNDEIDEFLYARLITPNGSRFAQAIVTNLD